LRRRLDLADQAETWIRSARAFAAILAGAAKPDIHADGRTLLPAPQGILVSLWTGAFGHAFHQKRGHCMQT
jgi:hypothetical protein